MAAYFWMKAYAAGIWMTNAAVRLHEKWSVRGSQARDLLVTWPKPSR